jgi:hypothetical protein
VPALRMEPGPLGGRYPLLSAPIMTLVPANVASCEEVIACLPQGTSDGIQRPRQFHQVGRRTLLCHRLSSQGSAVILQGEAKPSRCHTRLPCQRGIA